MERPRQHVVPYLDGRVGGVATAGYPIRIRFSTTEWWLPGTSQLSQSPLYQLLCDDRPSLRDGDGDAYDRDGDHSD
jgi:hypothetical protein